MNYADSTYSNNGSIDEKDFYITGEYSGDIHASNVVKELRALNSDVQIEGIGGINLESQGVKLFTNQDKMSAMGISSQILINHIKLGKAVVDYLKNDYKPDLVLLIDYGAFNLCVAKFLHDAGIKIFYIFLHKFGQVENTELNLSKSLWIRFCVFFHLKNLFMLNME